MVDPGEGLRFEATVHPGDADVPLESVADLDLDRVPDPQRGVRLLVTADEIVALLERGYEVRLYRLARVEPLSPDLRVDDDEAMHGSRSGSRASRARRGRALMYRTVAQLDSLTNLLAAWFPAYFMRFPLPEPSVQGRPVFALRLRAGGGGERRGVLLVGGTHARELMNPDAIIELAVDLFVSHVTGTDITYGKRTWSAADIKLILETLDLWLVPCMNPDGRVHVMTVDDLWRKNRRDNPGTECDGVDLNRNFDVLWGVTQGQTSCAQCSEVYAGPKAFSEPETRNIQHVLDTRRVNCFVDVHSYSELVLWPWGHAPSQTVDPSKRFTTLPTGTCAPIGVAGYQEYIPPRDLQRFQTVGSRIVTRSPPCAAVCTPASRQSPSTRRPGRRATTPTAGTSPTPACARPTASPSRRARGPATSRTPSIRPTRR